jgi:molybdenum cofactor guanylyltransferase
MVVGVVLAGGRSLRMGTDKGALVVAGRSLGQRACTLLSSICDDVVVVAPGHMELPWCSVPRIADPGDGPLMAAQTVIQAKPEAPAWLFVPVDQPMILRATLAAMVANPADRVRPMPRAGDNRDETLPWLLRSSGVVALTAATATGRRALHHVAASGWVEFTDLERLNCNDPADWLRLAVASMALAAL